MSGRYAAYSRLTLDYPSKRILRLTFNRPEVMNALTFEIYAQLRDLFESLRYDDQVAKVSLIGERVAT